MRVALTGGTGFLGAHTAEGLIAAGHEPVCLVRPTSDRAHLDALGVTQVPGNVTDDDSLRRLVRDVDAVVHCAGTVAAHRARDYDTTNLGGTERIAAAIRERGAGGPALHLVSSLAAKGPSPGAAPAPADGPARPVSAYGRSKLAAERAARGLAPDNGVTIIRPPALYGPRDRGMLPILRIARRGLFPAIGPADARISMLYGPDCARLIVALLGNEHGAAGVRVVEPADGPGRDAAALRAALQEAVGGRPLRTLRIPRAVLAAAARLSSLSGRVTGSPSMLNPDKARELTAAHWLADTSTLTGIDWTARTGLTAGLQETARWYESEGWL